MASNKAFLTEENKKKICDALTFAGPVDPNNYCIFKLNCSGFEISLTAGSPKEAATTFGHCLFSILTERIYTKDSPLVFQCENLESGETLEYLGYVIVSGTE